MTIAREPPSPGQESVWDYPRPPRLEPVSERITVVFNNEEIANTARAYRVLETSHPPVYYLPPEDLKREFLVPSHRRSFCEWKGRAGYFDAIVEGRRYPRVAWSYASPVPRFADLRDYYAFYLPAIEAGYVDDERAEPQPGGFYGGWVTSDLVGPFKGGPGSSGW